MADCTACSPSKVMHVSVLSVFAFLAVVAVIFRLWARWIKSARLDLNDYLCIGGLVFALASTVLSVCSLVYWGFYSPSVAGDPEVVVNRYKALLAGHLLWITAVTLIRASLLFLYIGIFRTPRFRTACYWALTINLVYFTITVLAECLICRPFAYNWNQSIKGTCGDQKSLELFIGVFNLLMDVTTVVLPLPVLWGLQMPTGRKVALSIIFSMGTAICIITLVRIKATTDTTETNVADEYPLITLLTCLESSLGVVNACLPVSKPVFDKLKPGSLIDTFSVWLSSQRSTASRSHELSAQPKQISWPMENQPKKKERSISQESTVHLPNAVWTPPLSQRKDLETDRVDMLYPIDSHE